MSDQDLRIKIRAALATARGQELVAQFARSLSQAPDMPSMVPEAVSGLVEEHLIQAARRRGIILSDQELAELDKQIELAAKEK